MFSCEQHCNIVPQYGNSDKAECSEQFASDANKLQVEIHKRFVNKASDWTISKKEANQIV
jgi:hypothetical protein